MGRDKLHINQYYGTSANLDQETERKMLQMSKMGVAACAAASLALAWALPALAQEANEIGTFGDWKAFSYEGPDGKLCFISSQPKRAEGKYSQRGEIYVHVTHWADSGSVNEVSFTAGYTHAPGSEVDVSIHRRKFSLFTEEDTAWAQDTKTDAAMVQAMRSGNRMIVRGKSKRGTLTKDTYSLMGFTKAHRAITRACNVQG